MLHLMIVESSLLISEGIGRLQLLEICGIQWKTPYLPSHFFAFVSIDLDFKETFPVLMDPNKYERQYPLVCAPHGSPLSSFNWLFTPTATLQCCSICGSEGRFRVICDGCRVSICCSTISNSDGCLVLREFQNNWGEDEKFYCPTCCDKQKVVFEVNFYHNFHSSRLYPKLTFRWLMSNEMDIKHPFPRPRQPVCKDDLILICMTYKDEKERLVDRVIESSMALALSPLGKVSPSTLLHFMFYSPTHR